MNTPILRYILAAALALGFVAAAPAQEPMVPPAYDEPPRFSQAELDSMLAPIALYPDQMLSQLLMAATFPRDVSEAAAWSRANRQAAGEAAVRAVANMPWDPSVKSLVAFPQVLAMMDEHMEWTERLGDAFMANPTQVSETIQVLRGRADQAGNLRSSEEMLVQRDYGNYVIEPARPDVVYVPSYDPSAATVPQPAQPSAGVNPWIAFGGGAIVGALGAWALYSIFSDDDDDENHHYHGGNQIHRYNNYYYAGGRRPPRANWTPRPRPYRAYGHGVQRPQPLQHTATVGTAKHSRSVLRPPTSASTMETQRQPTKKERREQHHEEQQARKEQHQEQKAERREEHQERQKQQKAQRREHQDEQQRQEAARREQRREREEAERRQRQETHQQKQQEQKQQQQERQQRKSQQPKQGQGGNGKGNQGKNGTQAQKKKGQGGQEQ